MAEVTAEPGWALVISNAATALITGGLSWLAGRPRKKSRAEDNLTAIEGFQHLADQQRAEMDRLVERIEAADTLIRQLRDETHEVRGRFTKLLGYVQTQLVAYVAELHAAIREAGREPPPMPPLPDLSPAKRIEP